MPVCFESSSKLLLGCAFGVSLNVKIAWMHLHQQRGSIANCFGIVVDARSVGSAHFDQRASGARHDLRQPEAASDFY